MIADHFGSGNSYLDSSLIVAFLPTRVCYHGGENFSGCG